MTILGLIILTAVLLVFLLDTLSLYLNIRSMGEEPPEEFKELADLATWQRTKDYAYDLATLGMVSSTIKLVTFLAWWFGGGFHWLDRLIAAWHIGELAFGMIYIGLLLFVSKLISLPFKIYGTFVVEARYGFNKTKPTTFVGDKAKGLLISIVLGGPFLIVVLFFFNIPGVWHGSIAWGWPRRSCCFSSTSPRSG